MDVLLMGNFSSDAWQIVANEYHALFNFIPNDIYNRINKNIKCIEGD